MALQPKDGSMDMVFPTSIKGYLPDWKDIPEEFKRHGNKWVKVVRDWFFCGLTDAKWTPKPGIDERKALRHVKYCMGSWEPKHEHKEAGCAFLLSEFFEDVTYTRRKLPLELP